MLNMLNKTSNQKMMEHLYDQMMEQRREEMMDELRVLELDRMKEHLLNYLSSRLDHCNFQN